MRRILILLTLLVVSLGGYFFYQDHLNNKLMSQSVFDQVMKEKMDDLYVQAKNWQQPINLKIEDERLDGDYKILSEFVLKYWIDNIEARNSYLRQLDWIKWDEFLNIDRLDKDRLQSYPQTKLMLSTVTQATTDFEAKNKRIGEHALAEVELLSINQKLKQSMKDKLRLTQNASNEIALLHIEMEILERAEAMFEMLKSRKWVKKDNMILFAKDEDVRKFNLLYAEINEFQQQIEQLKRENASVFEEHSADKAQ